MDAKDYPTCQRQLEIMQLVHVNSLVVVYPNGPRAILSSRALILSLVGVTKHVLHGKSVIQIAMDLMHHLVYIGSPYSINVMYSGKLLQSYKIRHSFNE